MAWMICVVLGTIGFLFGYGMGVHAERKRWSVTYTDDRHPTSRL